MRRIGVIFAALIAVMLCAFNVINNRIEHSSNDNDEKKVNKPSTATIDSAFISFYKDSLYQLLELVDKGLKKEVFEHAMEGFLYLKASNKIKNDVLSIVDFSVRSNIKRLYIIDVKNQKLLHHTLVSHGRNSGDVMASQFSNKPESFQSSLGFYITGETYIGSNGYSMRLTGVEKNFNNNAFERAIVMHGATYVSDEIAKATKRIGRSFGCPAVSVKEHKAIINDIKDGSCLFIYANNDHYLSHSPILKSSDRAGIL
ncbi:murein L,D-transpeptidase catalytic domain family protein [Polluticaenibacter yanchengensis]|uniref:Murein L,D-transpeptidase catalytic domain family protein n=1 Tax=Polluticaenibacter yanchengensis TaxID=3014562 RepID=A0ABT4UGL1_9BACT|nr:murein L,D-transpeptidase catalytic domain family protein [Chitinophagaceae bacterium LY-5]